MSKGFLGRLLITCMLISLWGNSKAQDSAQQTYSLAEAINYALQHSITVKNSQLDAKSASARVGEIRAIGLPQVTGSASITDNAIIQTTFLPAVFFWRPDSGTPPPPADAPPIPVNFGTQWIGGASVSAEQLLFDGSYFVGLKAAGTYKELAQKNLAQSKIEVAESVAKAYYSTLVNQERLELLRTNVTRLDTLLVETRIIFENGLAEKIDVDRIEVQLNNLKTERAKVERIVDLSYNLLKFQMGLPLESPLSLTDQLSDIQMESFTAAPSGDFNYSQRIEYSILQTQKELANLDIRNIRMGYYPRLSAFGNYGYNVGSNTFDIFSRRWFNYASLGVQLSVPIFDGLTKHYKIQQAKITYEKANQSGEQLKQNIDLQIRQASISLNNALESLENQRRNMELAKEVSRVAEIKYQEGVGSNIEVINAEAAYKEAQTNYYSALYDALVAKVDLEKATGRLLVE